MPTTNRLLVLPAMLTANDHHQYGLRGSALLRRMLACVTMFLFGSAMALAEPVSENNLPPASAPILHSIINDARASAQQDYEMTDHNLADELKDMSYENYREIRFDSEDSLWRGVNNFEVQFFHPGFLYQQPVSIFTVGADNQAQPLPFSPQSFNYTGSAQPLAKVTKESDGYAGFRVHYPIKNKQYKDEFAVFLGASYFRLVGKEHVYGLSARGLAIDTGMPEGEEFPHFTSFWLIEPDDGDAMIIYARLESPSVSAAYKFTVMPGRQTTMQVESWLFAREDVTKLGIAPFTSMFLYGENTAVKPDDYRPEVHDSDGMVLRTSNGEQIWRVLTNPAQLQITSLSDNAPAGFGMLQRDTRFASYLDGEANYHQRPGLWVTPKTGFGEGRLELVEIPTQSETHDNIVAYWVPAEPLLSGESRYFAYQLDTVTGNKESTLATVVRTRQGAAVLPGEKNKQVKSRRFAVDFAVPENLKIEAEALNLAVETNQGQIHHARVYPVNDGNLLRATFLLTPQKAQPADMRVYLQQDNQLISEVWNYVYHAQ
ncbi:glucan biosynthesis protein [Alteromonas gilva]|uniref:Glucan biosynthesis protein G n=1 Tax=Alteromonas gilva TaxID=2987522 RepID=A0ABT5KX36_9ALTE|nr:glucan biosynthesis protein G [Alteromonas gilva]MDC8829330.1 glucan biosynthesis protein G [Alteromonas gilva]